jgi:hypothetical protein
MMRFLPALALIGVLVAAVSASAWYQSAPTLPVGRFVVQPETIAEGTGLSVKRLNIVANGAKGIRLSQGAGDESWLSLASTPTLSDGLQRVQLVFVADKSLDLGTDHCSVTWLAQITTTAGARVGGPSRYSLPRDTDLNEFVQLDLPQGEYAIGETLRLGWVDTETLDVTIETLERAPERE